VDFRKEISELKQRLSVLDAAFYDVLYGESKGDEVAMTLTLPEADIGGLHFNETKVHAVFEKRDDGWWHSRDILFLSARNSENNNSRDILTEYLASDAFRECIQRGLTEAVFGDRFYLSKIAVSLPTKFEGSKKYNGVDCWYWLADPSAGSEVRFRTNYSLDSAYFGSASTVGGCAPMFCVVEWGLLEAGRQ
jgi:hypothetical protein